MARERKMLSLPGQRAEGLKPGFILFEQQAEFLLKLLTEEGAEHHVGPEKVGKEYRAWV